jgi:hypothetical protein
MVTEGGLSIAEVGKRLSIPKSTFIPEICSRRRGNKGYFLASIPTHPYELIYEICC